VDEEGDDAELGDAERERGSGCSHGERHRCAPARSVGHGRESRGEEEVAGEGERGQGSLTSPWRREDRAKGEQEVELGCARVDTASSSWQKLGDDWQGLVGWANWASSR